MTNPTALVQKLWNYCSILRDDGLSYGNYVEMRYCKNDRRRQMFPDRSFWHSPHSKRLPV